MSRIPEPAATLRPAGRADEEWLWRLANDDGVRAASGSTGWIDRDQHHDWYRAFLRSGAVHRVLEIGCQPVGWARVEPMHDGAGRVSVALSPRARGRGWGTPLIRAVTVLAREAGLTPVYAEIKPDNMPSRRAFAAAGYCLSGESDDMVLYRAG